MGYIDVSSDLCSVLRHSYRFSMGSATLALRDVKNMCVCPQVLCVYVCVCGGGKYGGCICVPLVKVSQLL